jgi:hypothetical protein
MTTTPNKKDRRKLKALLAMSEKMQDYYNTLHPDTRQHLNADYSDGHTIGHLHSFHRNTNDALNQIEHGTN